MKILQVCIFIDQFQGGAPCSTLGSFLALSSAGIETEIFALGESFNSSTKSGFLPKLDIHLRQRIRLITRKKQKSHGHFLKLSEMKMLFISIRNQDCIIVHQVYGLHTIYVYLFCRLNKKPYIVMPHGSLTSYDQNHHRLRKRIANRLFMNHFISRANSIFVATQIESLELGRLFTTQDISTVGLGYPIESDYKIYRKKRISDPINVLFMGRLTEKKRLDLTIRAIAELISKQYRVELIVAGDGSDEMVQQYRNLSRELGISESVRFIGWVTGEEKYRRILYADYFVLNSEDENFAVIVPEVQSYGVPVLLSNKVAFSDFISRHNSGVVVDSLEISSIVQGFVKLFAMNLDMLSENAIKCAKESEWDQVILIWIKRLNYILENSK